MGAANCYPRPRAIREEEDQTHPCHRCPIKAQVAASVGLTGLSLDFTNKGVLDDPSQRQSKKGSLHVPPALRMLSCPDLPRP